MPPSSSSSSSSSAAAAAASLLEMGSTHATQLVVSLIFLVIFGSNLIAGQTFSSNSSKPGTNVADANNNVSRPLIQSDDTVRVDPLKDFKKYRGGYDIKNKHYWSSTMFTGVYGYAIGVIWLLGGIAYGGFLLATVFCCKNRRNEKLKKRLPCHNQCYLWPILLAVFFTILAITASGLVLGGNAKFHSRAKTVVDIIIDTANNATRTIFLTSTSEKLDVGAADIERQARKNRRLIDKGLKIVYIVTTVTVSLNLAALIALSVCGTLRLRRPLNILIVVCWILTVLCWIFFGLYFFLQNFSRDSCTALESFQQNPYNNSLSSILPCDQLLSAKPILSDISQGIYSLVIQVNANLSTIQGMPYKVCNPFSAPPEYQFQADKCPSNTIRIGDIPQVLKVLTCSSFDNGTCASGQFISPYDYITAEAYSTSIQSLLNVYPEMENLVECQTVKDALSEILLYHCKPLKRSIRMVWTSLVFLSLVMVFLVLIWAKLAQHEQEHHSVDSCVKPHSAVAKEPETGTRDSSNQTSPV
ncbi:TRANSMEMBRANE PROTEIN [Salix koriyanagi]|uniref:TRANSMEMBRANE PROTEIN n=1 Tax=Salix koriyanagi TaxID=2511006 RepID=A0A9Q0SVK0_9ROSI|nr:TRANSMEMBRANE PROTEIN [Salix koriyanagi]